METDDEYGSVGHDATGPLIELLGEYLLASPAGGCPGADGQTVEEVVAADYPAAVAAGHVPGPVELVRRHPDLAAAIGGFFARRGLPPAGSDGIGP
jgi:hypothetical protein